MNLHISDVRFRAGTTIDERGGLYGWASFVLNESMLVASVAVRRTRSGAMALAFPTRRDRQGVEHTIVAPITHAAQRELEEQVVAELRRMGAVR